MNFPQPELSIIIPTRNEAQNIVSCLERVVAICPEAEILVIDGGSDSTEQICREYSTSHPSVRYIRNHGDRGKGHAVQTGINHARGRCVVQIDADLQFFPEEIPLLIAPLQKGEADMTLGTRFMSGSERRPGSTPWHRTLGNRAISAYTSLLFGQRFSDVLAGMKAWRRELTEQFSLESDTYSYEAELIAKAVRGGWRVLDVPVTTEIRNAGHSSVRVFKTGCQLLRDIACFRVQRLHQAGRVNNDL